MNIKEKSNNKNFLTEMKKYFIYSIVLMMFLSGVASAEVSSSTQNRIDEIKQKITDIKKSAVEEKNKIKAELESTRAGLKNELKSAAEIRIGKKLDEQKTKVAGVFEKAIKNMRDLITRVESRISKMEAGNINVSYSKSLLDIAKSKLSSAEAELSSLENLLAQNIPTATSTKNAERKTLLQNIKVESEKTKSAIKTAHQSIINVVNSLKPGLTKKDERASTTEKVSTSTSSSTNN